jgi:hypothetical protein
MAFLLTIPFSSTNATHYHPRKDYRELYQIGFEMGADWYSATVMYGYLLRSLKMAEKKGLGWDMLTHQAKIQFHQELRKIQKQLPKPFVITHLLTETHSRMENVDAAEMLDYVVYVVGFPPHNNLKKNTPLAKKLERFRTNNPELFSLVDVDKTQKFVAGVEWDYSSIFIEDIEEAKKRAESKSDS